MESKYHRKIIVLITVIAHILSLEDVIFRSVFFLVSRV